jgi:photosystem II stability/assembly factor-like uncharacterized protein
LAGNKNTILKTTDSGITWKVVYTDSSTFFIFINEVEFITDSVGYAIGREGIFLKTNDQGETWILSVLDFQPNNLKEIEFLNQSIGFINTGSDSEILKSTDGGVSWTAIPLPDGLPQSGFIKGINFIDESVGFLSIQCIGSSGIYKSTDSGSSWYQVSTDINGWIERSFNFFDSSNGIITFSDPMNIFRIYITADGGETWNIAEQPITAGIEAIGLCYYNQNIVFSTGNIGRMFKSPDGGHNWEQISHNDLDGYIEDAIVFDQDNGILLTNTFNGHSKVLKTTDGFESFGNLLTMPVQSKFITFPDPVHGFCFYKDYPYLISYRTNDGGNSWINDTISDFYALVINHTDFWDSQKGIILCDERFFITLNGGELWEERYIAEESEYSSIDWISENDIVISGITQDTSVLFVSHDTGLTWETIDIPVYEKVKFINEEIAFLFLYNLILKTADGGYTWHECVVNTDAFNSFRDISFPTPDTGYIAGWAYYNNMLKSVDAGETWNPVNAPVTSAFNHVEFTDSQNGYIFNLNDIFKTTTGGIVGVTSPAYDTNSELFHLYPNPFKDEIKIDMKNSGPNDRLEMRIINSEGKEVHSTTITGNPSLVILNGSSLKPGVYFFGFIKNGSVIETKKMIKK